MFHSPTLIFMSRAAKKAVKIKTNKTEVKTVVLYRSATWPVTDMDMERLDTGRGTC